MKKILLIGDYKDNGGPPNVNRELLMHSNNRLNCIKSDNKYLKIIETLIKIIFNKTIVISGYSTKALLYTNIAHILRKKVIYIMHGCLKYENTMNSLNLDLNYVNSELNFLKKVDLILCVSELYSNWVKNYYPDVKDKISYLNNGIPKLEENYKSKVKNNKTKVIALIGGNRNIKNNLIVTTAIDELIEEGYKLKVKLFGRNYDGNENISSKNVEYMGMVPKDKLLEELRNSDIYINNSHVEPFGLSVIDALVSGCDIVINKYVGAASIFKIDKEFVINSENDIKEIKEKIIYVLNNHNNQSVYETIYKDCDYINTTNKLIDICNSK